MMQSLARILQTTCSQIGCAMQMHDPYLFALEALEIVWWIVIIFFGAIVALTALAEFFGRDK